MNAADFLKSKGITQQDIADQLGCTRANVNMWFCGDSSPTVASIERITEAMNALAANTCYEEVFKALYETRKEREGREKKDD